VEEGPLDLNRATALELQELPGIGPVLAERIVAFRERQGPFLSVEDLLQVPGIGEKTLELFRDLVTVEGPK
jgi:competence protein ComEA